MIIDLTIFCGC